MVHNEGAVKRDPQEIVIFQVKNEGSFQELHSAVSGGKNWVDETPLNLMICKVDKCQP